jgi:uncharacterized membrane protein YuzA (DUF378 family)
MNRDVSWRRIGVALLVGCSIFAAGKFAYGFQTSFAEMVPIVIFMAVVFGLAALILAFRDKVALKANMSAKDRELAITKRSNRLKKGWGVAIFSMALVAVPVHLFGFQDEPAWQRILYLGLAAVVVISFLLNRYSSRNQHSEGDQEVARPDGDER